MNSMAVISATFNFAKNLFVVVFMWLLVLISALAVVYSVFDSRVKFNALESLRAEHTALQVAWGQYLLEESTWASYGRVERIATEALSMKVPEPRQTILVRSNEN